MCLDIAASELLGAVGLARFMWLFPGPRTANSSPLFPGGRRLMLATPCFMAVLSGCGSGERENNGKSSWSEYDEGSSHPNVPCSTEHRPLQFDVKN